MTWPCRFHIDQRYLLPVQACLQLCIKGASNQLPDAVAFLADECSRLRAGFPCTRLMLPSLRADDAVPRAAGGNVILWCVSCLELLLVEPTRCIAGIAAASDRQNDCRRDDSEARASAMTQHRTSARQMQTVSEHGRAVLKVTITQYAAAKTVRGQALVRGGGDLRMCLHAQMRPGALRQL